MYINIYHTNDIHSEYKFLNKVHKFMKENKKEDDFYFDIGDYTDLKSVLVESDKGNMAMELFMQCGLDLMAIGNNEIDLEYDGVKNLVNKFPIISTNLTNANDEEIPGLKKSVILEKKGKKFLIMSVAPYFGNKFTHGKYNVFFMLGNLKTYDPISAIKDELNINKEKYDFCILMSHSGHLVDEKLIEEIPEIDLILGAHTHIRTIGEKYSMCGKGEVLGKVKLNIYDDNVSISEITHIELNNSKNEYFEEIFEEKIKNANNILSKEITSVKTLDFNPFRENDLINFICDALYKHIDCDFAVMHNGIAEGNLTQPVSRKTLLENFPSKLNPTSYNIEGKYIKKAIIQSLDDEFIRQPGNGGGFRGSVLGTLGFSNNVQISKDPFFVKINNEELDEKKLYRIATDDYLQRGTGYNSLKVPNEISKFENMFIRDLVALYINDKELVENSKIKRII